MNDPFWNDEQFACPDLARRLPLNVHLHLTFEYIEEIIRLIMLVEWIFTDELHNHDFIFVVICNHMGIPVR